MRTIVALAAAVMTAAAGSAVAAPDCYSAPEIQAEQAILFQTELMVVAEACRDPSYVRFLKRNIGSIKAFQHVMIEHFRRTGAANPEAKLDSYLTRLANQSSLRNGDVPVVTLCNAGAPLMAKANSLGNDGFRAYASEKAKENGRYYRRCTATTAGVE